MIKKALTILLIIISLSCEKEDAIDICSTNVFIVNENHDNVMVHVYFYDDFSLVLGATFENVVKNQTLEFFDLTAITCRVRVYKTIDGELVLDSYKLKIKECKDNILYLN